MKQTSSPRWLNIALGTWLFLSAFLWLHSPSQFTNTWIVGLAAVVLGAIGTRFDSLRYANTALAAWLFVSGWIVPTASEGTFWNNLLVSVAMVAVSLIPRTATVRRTSAGPSSEPLSARH